jgi:hypothetical protein
MLINPLGKVKLVLATNGTGQVSLQCSPHQTDTTAADKIKESVQTNRRMNWMAKVQSPLSVLVLSSGL